jgi:hypothetical protein
MRRPNGQIGLGLAWYCEQLLNRGRGIFVRPEVKGSETKYRTFYRLASGQLIYSKLFGWEGAVTIVPDSFDGYYVSPEFPTFKLDQNRVLPSYMTSITRWEGLHARLAGAGSGLGQRRQRVQIEDFLATTIPLPGDIHRQRQIASWVIKLLDMRLVTRHRKHLGYALVASVFDRTFGASE